MFRLRHWWNRRSHKTQVRMLFMVGITGVPLSWLANGYITGVWTPDKFWGDAFLWSLVAVVWFYFEIVWLWRKAIYGD